MDTKKNYNSGVDKNPIIMAALKTKPMLISRYFMHMLKLYFKSNLTARSACSTQTTNPPSRNVISFSPSQEINFQNQ
jgi:hypothetical protein